MKVSENQRQGNAYFYNIDGAKEYKLWCSNSKSTNFFINRDVTFDEFAMLLYEKQFDIKTTSM